MRGIECAVLFCLTGELLDQVFVHITQNIVVAARRGNEIHQIHNITDSLIAGPGVLAQLGQTALQGAEYLVEERLMLFVQVQIEIIQCLRYILGTQIRSCLLPHREQVLVADEIADTVLELVFGGIVYILQILCLTAEVMEIIHFLIA